MNLDENSPLPPKSVVVPAPAPGDDSAGSSNSDDCAWHVDLTYKNGCTNDDNCKFLILLILLVHVLCVLFLGMCQRIVSYS